MMARPFRQSGVSLVEALVAMAVMAFGMLALVGLQGVLRSNSDVSRQRAEGVRFAQEFIEEKRAFSALETGGAGRAYASILYDENAPAASDTGYTSSATFGRVLNVTDLPSGSTTDEELYYMAPRKQLDVVVTWKDRNGEEQRVGLNTIVSRTSPELAGSLSASGDGSLAQQRSGRHRAIPPGAINLTDAPGKSVFSPPGSSGVYWKFDNATGNILETCTSISVTGDSVTASGCAKFLRYLLTGYIRYAVSGGAPGSTESETPPDPVLGVSGVAVNVVVHLDSYSDAAEAAPELCYAELTGSSAYYCAVPYDAGTKTWSGRSTVTFNQCWSRTTRKYNTDPFSETYAADLISPYRCTPTDADLFAADSTLNPEKTALADAADSKPTRHRVCRYTAKRDQSLVNYTTAESAPAKPWIQNSEHPRDYQGVPGPLANQNFLIIRAGDGTTPFNCPDDNTNTLLNGKTWFHQPS